MDDELQYYDRYHASVSSITALYTLSTNHRSRASHRRHQARSNSPNAATTV